MKDGSEAWKRLINRDFYESIKIKTTTGFPIVVFRCIFRIFFSFFVKCLLNPLFRFKHFRKCPKLLSFKTPVSNLAETVGFEPTYQLPDKRISSAPRYDRFDTSAYIVPDTVFDAGTFILSFDDFPILPNLLSVLQ